ncbi:MAG: hypothetical protein IT462_04505 [Planctomycetes bacterium]|nr:hypothetical protein [Planctomycetota bacterium]
MFAVAMLTVLITCLFVLIFHLLTPVTGITVQAMLAWGGGLRRRRGGVLILLFALPALGVAYLTVKWSRYCLWRE